MGAALPSVLSGAPPYCIRRVGYAGTDFTQNILRTSTEYQKAREEYRYRAQHHRNRDGTTGEKCWLCSQPIDYLLKFPHPRSWSLDHVVPVKDNPALMLNAAGWRSAHFDCNSRRGSDAAPIDLGEPSEAW
jgi:5-methylcytosine-specific restriction endonuclease McrA